MTAFDQAWVLLKEWTPDWRERAERLKRFTLEDEPETYLNDPFWMEDNLLGEEGSELTAYKHPFDRRFAMKIPNSANVAFSMRRKDPNFQWSASGVRAGNAIPYEARNDYFDSRIRPHRQGIWEQYMGRKGLPQIMEELGFPVVSEMLIEADDDGEGLSHLVQPIMIQDTHDAREQFGLPGDKYQGWKYSPEDRKRSLSESRAVEQALAYAFGDYVNADNFMRDPQGRLRFIDFGTDFADLYDAGEGNTAIAEAQADRMIGHGMQIPATRLLNEMDKNVIDRPYYRQYLEDIEPFMDNPKFLTVDGKALWRGDGE